MSLKARMKNRHHSTRKLTNDLGYWTNRATKNVGLGLGYLWKSKGLKHDIKEYQKTRRNNHYKKKLVNIKKKIIQQKYVLEDLARKEKNIYDQYKYENEMDRFNQRYKDKKSIHHYRNKNRSYRNKNRSYRNSSF